MPEVEPSCSGNHVWNEIRKCCEWALPPDGCPGGGLALFLNDDGECTNEDRESAIGEPYDERDLWFYYQPIEDVEQGFLTEIFDDLARSSGVYKFGWTVDVIEEVFGYTAPEGEGMSDPPYPLENSTVYDERNYDGIYPFSGGPSLLNLACQMTYTPTNIPQSSVAWNGCQCEDVFTPALLGMPTVFSGTFSGTTEQFGTPWYDWEYRIHLPNPLFGLEMRHNNYYGMDCAREVPLWNCPLKYENPQDAGEDTFPRDGLPSVCNPICEGVGTCPTGYTYDPELGLCVRDDSYNTLSLSEGFGSKRFLTLIDGDGSLGYFTYNDSQPRGMSSFNTLFNAEVATSHIDKSGKWWIVFSDGDNVNYIYNSKSGAIGEWSSPVTLTTGYRCVAHVIDKFGRWVFICWKESDSKLYVIVAKAGVGGVPEDMSAAVKINDTEALPSAGLLVDKAGIFNLAMNTVAGDIFNLRCKKLSSDAAGTWA
jgi:hypothetical protein